MTTAPELTVEYDDGYFDKDEQGWCARRVAITQDGDRVIVRAWGDDNGARPYDRRTSYGIGGYWPEQGLVRLDGDAAGRRAYFDLATRRLRDAREQETAWFAPPPGYRDDGWCEAIAAMLVPVAGVLGLEVRPPPAPVTLPPLAPSPTSTGVEARVEVLVGAARWGFMARDFVDGAAPDLGPQLEVRVVGGDAIHVSLFVQSPRRALFLLMGPLERYPDARLARDAVLGRWRGDAPG
ncbi:MAG: hypothetical protein H6709_02350 [Kofleriaceae bacterium]|nr:hypothetical protein [Kofleriaceae bacterium]